MIRAGFPAGLFLFLTAFHVVTILVYVVLPLTMAVPVVGRWLKAPRPAPHLMHPLHAVLDQGLQMFALKMAPPLSEGMAPLLRRLETLESKVGRLREVNHRLNRELREGREGRGEGGLGGQEGQGGQGGQGVGATTTTATTNSTTASSPTAATAMDHYIHQSDSAIAAIESFAQKRGMGGHSMRGPSYVSASAPAASAASVSASVASWDQGNGMSKDREDRDNRDTSITMAVRHYVKWECVLDFELWTDQIEAEMGKWEGFKGLVRIAPKSEGDPYINSFTFSSYPHLHAFSVSPGRDALLRRLEPLLEATSQAEVTEVSIHTYAHTYICTYIYTHINTLINTHHSKSRAQGFRGL
jgi:antibiotic biosynthesis monooxygenase (ABM) superfamily enzyme